MTVGKYLRWKDEQGNAFRPVSFTGTELLNDRTLNKSTAFTYEEREAFQLNGLLPPRVQTFEDQLNRVYDGFRSASTDIEKYLFYVPYRIVMKHFSMRYYLDMLKR